MPRKPNKTPIVCQFFTWRLFQRDGVFYADCRTATHNLGKHSLGTRDREKALANLRQLDLQRAIELGLTQANVEIASAAPAVADGWQLYLDHCARPQVMGGASAATRKRYQAVRDKHINFCHRRGIDTWAKIDKAAVQAYGVWLSKTDYADRSMFLELTLLKSVTGWLISEGHLPKTHAFDLPLTKPQGTDAHCYSQEEVVAMVDHCRLSAGLGGLSVVIVALACTGMRISELAGLR